MSEETQMVVVSGKIAHSLVKSTEMILGGDPRPTLLLAVVIAHCMARYGPALRGVPPEEMKVLITPIMERLDRELLASFKAGPRDEELVAKKDQLLKEAEEEVVSGGH